MTSWTEAERAQARVLLAGQRRGLVVLAVLLVLTTAAVLSGPALIGWGIDGAVRHDGHGRLYAAAGLFLGISVAGWAASVVQLRLFGRITERVLRRLREAVFAHALGQSAAWFEATPSGTLITRLTADVEAVALFFRTGLVPLATNIIVLLATLVFMVALSPPLFAIVGVTIIPLSILVFQHFLRRSRKAYDIARGRIATAMGVLAEGVAGLSVVRAFGAEAAQQRAFDEANGEQLATLTEANRIGGQFAAVVDVVGVLALIPVLIGGAWLYRGGHVSIGTVVAFVVYVSSVFDPVQQIGQFLGQATSARSAYASLATLLDDRAALPEPARSAEVVRVPARGAVALRGVRFAYPGTEHAVIADLDLEVAAGQRVALVGPSGAGKTTVAKLVARVVDPDAGRVTFGDVDLRALRLDDLRRRVVLVGQHAHLFQGSVADNVRLGRPEATDAEVRDVLAALVGAAAADALLRGGRRVSAGQRQVVSLARALLLDPAVLVLDEATAHVDPWTAAAMERVLDHAAVGRTLIVVAHRPATAERLDRVVVIAGGAVVEDGAPHALLARPGGAYARLKQAAHDEQAENVIS